MTTPTPPANPNLTSIPDFSAGAGYAKVTEDPHTVNKVEVKPAPKRKPLKPRDMRFIAAKVNNPDLPDYKAAMIATGAKDINTASTAAARMLQNATLRESLDEAMAKMGYSMDQIIAPVKDALEFDDPDGDQRTTLDMRLKGHDRAMKMLTIIAGEDKAAGGNTFNFIGQNNFVKKADA